MAEDQAITVDSALRSVAENSVDNIMLLDPQARIQYINQTVPDLTQEQVRGTPVYAFVDERWHARMRECFSRVAETHTPGSYETEYVAEDGSVSYWESRVGAVVQDGALVGFTVNSNNVTERRNAEADRERFFMLSLDMMCVASLDGYFKRLNPRFEKVLGFTNEELMAKPYLEFIHPDDRAATKEEADRLAAGGSVVDFENRYRCKDGSYRWFSWHATTDSSCAMIYGVARDITDRRALEGQLRQAQKMEAIGQLAGGVAHDFNNLVLAIQGNAGFVLSARDAEEREEFIGEIMAATQRAAQLTRQLLTLGRREAVQLTSLDLNRVADGAVRMLRRLIPESIELDLIPGHELATICADEGQVEQVLLNLCLNSRDAMPDGGRLTVETENVLINGSYRKTHPEAKPGRYVLLTVTDTGVGMSPEIRERAFEPFFSTKEPGEGTGLGLATVYGIVKQHGGMVSVYSEPDRGTTFKVYLPATERRADVVGSKLQEPVVGGSETILVAEDEAIVRRVVVRLLEGAGYTVLTASDGAEAVRVFKQNRDSIALALLDVVMPNVGGPAAYEDMIAERPDLPVLFSSGYNDGLPNGGLGSRLVPKPYEPDELLLIVRKAIDGS